MSKIEGHLVETDELCEQSHFSSTKARHGEAYISKSGTIYPCKFVAELLPNAIKRIPGLTIHPFNPVRSVAKEDGPVAAPLYSVKTDKGTIRCSVVVHATNAYASYFIPTLRRSARLQGRVHRHPAQRTPFQLGVRSLRSSQWPGFDEFWHWLIHRRINSPFIYGWPSVEKVGDYDDSDALPKGSDGKYAGWQVMEEFIESAFPLSFQAIDWDRALANRVMTDMGIRARDKRVEVLENGPQPPIFGFSEGQIALDDPFDH